MGEVWRARHRLLIRPAAIKLIRQRAMDAMGGDPELLVRRFEREARATAALTSPHTVQLYDFGVAEDGRLYYVMELLDGLDLDTPGQAARAAPGGAGRPPSAPGLLGAPGRPRQRPGPPRHQAGERGGRAGPEPPSTSSRCSTSGWSSSIAAARGGGGRRTPIDLSADGSWSGTPGYMAPEVVLGAADTDHRVDLYALGCVAYWLLTGLMVFEGESALQVMMQHAQAEPKRPSQRVDRPIPAALEDLVMQCLEKDPARRPASAEVVRERLDAVPLAAVWTAERAEQWWAMHRPRPLDARPVADVLLSHEGHELRIGPRVRPRGSQA